MIIFSGHGILIAIFAITGAFAGNYASTRMGLDAPLPLVITTWTSAIAVLLYALTLGKTPSRTLIDLQTNRKVETKKRHTLFSLPAMIWAFALCGVAAFVTLTSFTADLSFAAPGLESKSAGEIAFDATDLKLSNDSSATQENSPEAEASAQTMLNSVIELRDAGVNLTDERAVLDDDQSAPVTSPDVPRPAALDLKLSGADMSLTGRLRSEYQIKDIVAALEQSTFSLTNNLIADPDTERVDWGNRVGPLLADLATSVSDLHFYINDGAITIIGTVEDTAERNRLQRAITYVFETSVDITALNNKLRTQ